MKKLFLFLAVLVFGLWSCKKETTPAPAPPTIAFGSFITSDKDNAIVTITFNDADGDMGLHQSDTTGPYATGTTGYYDFYMRYYYWSPAAGKFIPFYYSFPNGNPYLDSAIFRYRIPFITNNTKSMSLDGQIIINLFQYQPAHNDTSYNIFKYDIWIYDRALHKSNVITTPSFTTNY